MAQRRGSTTRVDDDGVRTTNSPGVRAGVWIAAAVLVAVCVVWVVSSRRSADEVVADAPDRNRVSRPVDRSAPDRIARRMPPAPGGDVALPPRRDEAREDADEPVVPPVDAAEDADVEDYGQLSGGIGVFPPPGTDPLKRGIVVPEGFELPPGFMRHYQTTDDGKELRAILLFHPDHRPVDADGNPVPLPDDLVVPPELAPPGLDIEILDDPEPEIPLYEENEPES